jgi:hypothetical protein
MRPEVGFADLVRAIEHLDVSTSEEARAIAELISPGWTIYGVPPELSGPAAAVPQERPARAESSGRTDAPDVSLNESRRGRKVTDPPPLPLYRRDTDDVKRDPSPAMREAALYKQDLQRRSRESTDASTAAPLGIGDVDSDRVARGSASGTALGVVGVGRSRLPFQPMIEPGLARAIIGALIGRKEYDGPVDVGVAIGTLAQGQPLTRIPRRRRHTLRFGAQVLIDVAAEMMPYEPDLADLERRIREVAGAERIQIVRFRGPGAPIWPCGVPIGPVSKPPPRVRTERGWQPYEYPSPKTPVLALTDLSFTSGGLRSEEEEQWVELATNLAVNDSLLIILTPSPRDRLPSRLASVARIVQWDRATAHVSRSQFRAIRRTGDMAATNLQRVESPESTLSHPAAYALARLVALTARCEPALLRRLRRTFLPWADAWIEGELWASPLADVRAHDGLILRTDVVQAMLQSWAGDPKLAEVTAEIARAHDEEPRLLLFHEEIAACVAHGPESSAGRQRIAELLAGAAASVATNSRSLVGEWARHVLRQFPSLRSHPVAFQLAVIAGTDRVLLIEPGIHDAELLHAQTVMRAAAAKAVPFDLQSQAAAGAIPVGRSVGVRHEAGHAIFDPEASACAVVLLVPETHPVLLDVHTETQAVVVAVAEAPVKVPWERGAMHVYAVDGRGWRVAFGNEPAVDVDAPWSSIVWTPPPPEFAFGHVANRRTIAMPLEAVEPDSIDALNVRIAGVTVDARLLFADATSQVAVLSLKEDALVPSLAMAISTASIEEDGVLVLELDGTSAPRMAPARVARDRVMIERASDSVALGLPVVVDGELAGMVGELLEAGDGFASYRLIPSALVDGAVQRALDGDSGLRELADLVASDATYAEVEKAVARLMERVRLADAALDAFARTGSERRSAALLIWARTASRHAVRHALTALETATRTLEIEIAVNALTRLVQAKRVDGPHARRARRCIDAIAPAIIDETLRDHVEKLRAEVKLVEGAHDELKIERYEVPRFQHRGSLDILRSRLKNKLRVVGISGGLDGADRLGMAAALHQATTGYLALAWTFRGQDVERFCAFAAGALGIPSSAGMLEIARRAAELDANVLLDRIDRLSDDRDEAFAKLRAFAQPFVELERGRCIFTYRGVAHDFGFGEAAEVVSFSGFPPDLEFRKHLWTSLEFHERQIDDWIRGLVPWGPVAAVAAILYVVIETLPRWSNDRQDRNVESFLAALRGWLDQPGALTKDQRAALSASLGTKHKAAKRVSFERLGSLLQRAMEMAELSLSARDVDHDALGDVLAEVGQQVGFASASTIQAIVRRAYLGTGYVRDDIAEFVIAFDRSVHGRARDISRELTEITSTPVDLIDTIDDDKLGFRTRPSAFRLLRDRWRSGTLTTLGALRLRWFAESNPFPAHNDPQKGHWGGLPERAGRIVTATVSKPKGGWYNIRIQVAALPNLPPLRGTVRFHLHDTFPEQVVEAPVRRGIAEFTYNVWGAFTAGIECDRGATQLELDLADIPEADCSFLDEDHATDPSLAVASYGLDLPLQEGARWMYEPIGGKRGVTRSAQVMIVTEHVAHTNGVGAARIEGFIGRHSDIAATTIWLLARGDGRFYAIPDDKTLHRRLRDSADQLEDLTVVENLYLRFPLRAGSSFANASCTVQIRDVRFGMVRIKGLTRNAVVYEITQRWPSAQVRMSVAPGVGIISAIDHDGTAWKLVSFAERKAVGRSARTARKKKSARRR